MVSEEMEEKSAKLGQAGSSWAKLSQAGPSWAKTMAKEAKGIIENKARVQNGKYSVQNG